MVNTTVVQAKELAKQMKDSVCMQSNLNSDQVTVTVRAFKLSEDGIKHYVDFDGLEMEINS